MNTRTNQGRVFNFDTLEDWAAIRARYIDAFDGEMPHPKTEATIIEAFEAHPDAVRRELAKLATDRAAGKNITTGWGLAKKRAEQILTPASNPTAKTGIDREKAISRAESWMQSAGVHFDDPGEITLALFDNGGLLHAFAQAELVCPDGGTWRIETRGDLALIDRMTELWNTKRPVGVKIEADMLERADKWKRQQAAREEALAQAHAEVQAATVPADPDLPL